MQVLELALRQVNRQVSEPLLELRAPLVRPLQVVEPAPRLVPLNLLLELRGLTQVAEGSSSSIWAGRGAPDPSARQGASDFDPDPC